MPLNMIKEESFRMSQLERFCKVIIKPGIIKPGIIKPGI